MDEKQPAKQMSIKLYHVNYVKLMRLAKVLKMNMNFLINQIIGEKVGSDPAEIEAERRNRND